MTLFQTAVDLGYSCLLLEMYYSLLTIKWDKFYSMFSGTLTVEANRFSLIFEQKLKSYIFSKSTNGICDLRVSTFTLIFNVGLLWAKIGVKNQAVPWWFRNGFEIHFTSADSHWVWVCWTAILTSSGSRLRRHWTNHKQRRNKIGVVLLVKDNMKTFFTLSCLCIWNTICVRIHTHTSATSNRDLQCTYKNSSLTV